MNVFYYTNTIDETWDTLNNWWSDSIYTLSASNLPQEGDVVYIDGAITTAPSTPVTLYHVYVNKNTTTPNLSVDFTGITGSISLYNFSIQTGTIDGTATFNDNSYNTGVIRGHAIFNDKSYNTGIVLYDSSFNDESDNTGILNNDVKYSSINLLKTPFVYSGGVFMEGMSYKSLPQPQDIYPRFATEGISKSFTITGKKFKRINNVYLSGGPFSDISTLQTPFLSVYSLSAQFPSFVAYKLPVSAVDILSENKISFVMPAPSATGVFDVIVENIAGYSMFTVFGKNWSNYQKDYIKGIPVRENHEL